MKLSEVMRAIEREALFRIQEDQDIGIEPDEDDEDNQSSDA
jgi:hypothetical protein